MSGDKFDQLYNALYADGAVTGTRENFKKFVYAPGKQGYQNRKKLFDALHADGAVSSPTYEEFARRLGLHAVTPSAKQAPQQPKPTNNAPRKPMSTKEMSRQVAQQQRQQPQGTPDYMKNWNLLTKPNSQLTPLERSQAESLRSKMQKSRQVAQQKEQRKQNPITQSRTAVNNPLAATQPYYFTATADDFDSVIDRLSTPEAQRERAIQQHKDDAMAMAGGNVNDNSGVTSQIDSSVSPSMKEADDLSWAQYEEQLRAANGDAYLRNKAWKDYQDNRYKNRQEILSRNISLKLQDIYQDKNLQNQIVQSADKMNMGIEEYVDKYVTPQIMSRAQQVLGVKNIEEIMPKSSTEYVLRKLSDSILGMLSASQDKSKDSIMREQQAMAIADGIEEMPKVKGYKGKETYRSGVVARFLSTASNMAMDSPFLGMTGGAANLGVDLGKQILTTGLAKVGLVKAGAKLTAQQLGFKIANMTMAQKIGSGLLEGTAKGALNLGGYSGITAALGQASTGDDTSLSAVAQAGWEGAKHGAETGAIFGVSGAVMAPWIQRFGINGTEATRGQKILHGAQKAGATALGLGVEAGTMMVADNVTSDKEISVGQWLEDVVMVGAFKAGEPRNYGKIGQALYSITHNTSSTFRYGKDSDGNWRSVDIRLTDAEKNELINSTSGKNLMDAFGKVDKSNLNSKDNIDKNITKLAYQEFMADPNVSQSTKEKVNAAMGLFNTTRKRSYRSVNDTQNKQVLEYAEDGTLLTRTSYKSSTERESILYKQKENRRNDEILSKIGLAKTLGREVLDGDGNITPTGLEFLITEGYDVTKPSTDPKNDALLSSLTDKNSEIYKMWLDYADKHSLANVLIRLKNVYDESNKGAVKNILGLEKNAKNIYEALAKDPLKRTQSEIDGINEFEKELDQVLFDERKLHPEQSTKQGRTIAEDNNLGTASPEPEAVVTELRNLSEAEDALQEMMDTNDVFRDAYDNLKKQGLTNPQIYDAMINQNGLTEEQLEPFARYINANARVQGMQQATQEAMQQHVDTVAADWGFHGTMDGQKADGYQMLYVQDNNGRTLIVGSGDVAYDPTTGRPKDGVGDMLVCLDVQTREPVYVKVEDTTLFQTQDVEAFKQEELARLQQINSAPYNQAAQEQAMKDAAKPQPKEEETKRQEETIINGNQTDRSQQEGAANYTVANTLQKKVGSNLTKDEADSLVSEMESRPEKAIDLPLTPENWKSEFGENGEVNTPLGVAKMGENQLAKMFMKGREAELGLVKPTLENPDVIIEEASSTKEGDAERPSSYLFIKTFERDGKKIKFYASVSVKKDGMEVVVSNHFMNKNAVDRKLQEGKVLYIKGKSSSNSSDMHLAEHQNGGSDLLPTPESDLPSGGKDTNNSSNGNENNTSLTFEDGSPVPMVKDSKGRLTPDYGNMKPEQAAEILTKQFGESAEKVVDGQIKKAEKAVKDAEKMKVDYEGEPNDILEQEELKKKTIAEAQKQLEHAQAIKKAMTAKKVAETVGKTDGEPVEGANQAGSVAAQKFQKAPRITGNKRTRTLPNKEKVKGHYEIVPAESLTPSHDATNGYKKSDGFPVDENGHTTNDRDYENDKAAQQTTDQMALSYDGQAIDNVPVVSDEGIVYDGNGRTMAGQKAAKEGTDGEYVSELLDNAENFGFTREQIENSGIEHPRLVLVTDERLPYTTETFAKFNRNEKKAQNNTEQAVAKSKTLSPEDVGSIVSEIEGSGSLEAFFNNTNAISGLWKTLQEKGIIGQNEVAGLQDMPGVPNAQGKEFIKNLVLGAMFKPETIRMMGVDGTIKNKVINGIRAIMDNSKLGDYSLGEEMDSAINLLYEARTNKMSVDDLLRSSDFVQGNARDRYSEISQELAQALEGKTSVFRELMSEYNDVARNYNTDEGRLGFYENLDKEDLIKQFINKSETIKQNNIKLYGEERRNSEKEDGNVPTGNGQREEKAGGGTGEEKPAESQQRVDNAVKKLATEITKQTGVTVHTNEKESQKALEDAEATDSNIKYHKETDKEVLDELNSGKTIKVYRAMQVIDGKLYPPMAASVDGKLVEANELGTWIRADENPESAIPDIDPKTGKQKVDAKTGELKWKFKLDKGGKDATGKKATPINAAYNPYWHMSRSPLNDQFKSAWIRPNIVVVECEVPESELTSGYKAERAKDAVGEVDWKSGSVSGEVFKQTGRARKVILSRWCKPVRVLDDAEVAQRAKEFVGDAKVEIPENVLTPKQRVAFEEAGFKIGAPEKGVKKSEQIADALKAGLQVDNTVREHRGEAGGAVLDWGNVPTSSRISNDELTTIIMRNNRAYVDELDNLKEGETIEHYVDANGFFYTFRVDKNHHIYMDEAIPKTSSANKERIKELKNYYDEERTRLSEKIHSNRSEAQSELGRFEDTNRSTARERDNSDSGMGRTEQTDQTNNVERDSSRSKQDSSDSEIRQFRTKDGEVYGFVVDGEIHLDTKKMKPETPLHEYTHLWTSALQRVNAKEWDNVKSLLDSVEGLKDEVQKLYPDLKGDDLYDEMLATYSGREGTKKLEAEAKRIAEEEGKTLANSAKAKNFLEKVKEALKKYWNDVADMLHIKFTSAEEVADKVLADWANGVNPNEVKADEKSTNPLETLKKSAESYNEDKLNEARKAFKEAKDSGDTSEIKRTRDELKSMLNEKYKSQGMGLVQRRKEIAKEIGKAEAEMVNKPWSEMEFDEQVMETEKKPLDANEIKDSDCDPIDKANATAYLNGDRIIINTLSYLTVYDNVRNRERDSVSSIGAEDGTQLDAADNAGSEGLGRAGSRPQGVDSGQLGREEGNGNPESGKPLQSGERVSVGESGETHASSIDGERGGEQVHGESSRVEAVHGGGSESKGSSGVRGNGRDVRKRGNERGSSNGNGEATGSSEGRGIDSRNLSTVEAINKEIDSVQSEIDDLFNSLFDGRTKGDVKSDRANGSVIPLASDHLLGKLGMNRQKMEVYKKLIPLLTKRGYLEIKKGITKLSDWVESMKNSFGGHLTKLGLTDEEVYDYIKQMWNSNIEVDGKVRKLSEWASIMGTERMKKEIATPNAEKHKRQMEAEPIAVKIGDKKNIEETLPFLLPQQHEDVYRAETQFFGKEHTDREHAYGKGYMFTNGTGTGKTYTGLGIAKRLVKQGKGRILFVTPSQKKVTDWVNDGKNLGLNIKSLDDWAKERGTTATTESGDGCVITTFANFGLNKKLLETEWDAVIYDESHRIMENKKGAETARSMQHYMVTNRDENHCFLRLQTINPAYQKMQKAADDFAKQHEVERQKIIKEYKQSHPEATTKDVINATHKMMPRDINSFAPADSQTFPKLGKAYDNYIKAKSDYYNNVEPKLKQQAKETWKNTKTVFLSATPFNTRENLDYAEGYIFKYPESDGSKIGGRSRFYLDHFGAAYKFRYNRLESHVSNPDAVAKQEIAFSDYLQNTLGTMSGRIIDSPYDYSRDFPVVSPDHAEDFNNAVQECFHSKYLYAAYGKTIGDYNYGSALFETMKVANTIERIKQHLAAGRKVVIYHRRVETKEPIRPPFAYMLDVANQMISEMRKGKERDEFIKEVTAFREKHQDLLQWEQGLDYSMPREQIAKVFGKDNVLFFSGKESKKVKDKAVDTFNQDDSGKNILVIQEASGKEGISLHDTTGKHQRVVITLALPQSPITALQIEGRIYRIGNKSNAIFEYPILGLNSEMMLFGQKFNNQVSTTENLALGSQARNLRDSFAKGILEHSGIVPIENQGVGGKAFDAPKEQGESDPFEDSVLDYYSNQKLNKNNREGVDYFPTPEPLGYKMVQWAGLGDGDSVLEPSAGHGAIARYVPKSNEMVSIEPSQSLFSKLQLKAGGLGRKFLNNIFENYDIHNKHDAVIMNPPFGTAGATAIKHVDKAFRHLDEGGRIVAIIPRGSTDKKFDAWIAQNKDAVLRAEVNLPDITFQQAGTSVASRVVVLDKITDAKNREKAGRVETTDLSGHYEKIEDFFDDLRNIEMPSRIIDTNMKMLKKSRQSVKDIRDIKGVAYADLNKEEGVNVRMKNDWQNFYISFQNSDKPDVWKQKMASYYKQYDELQKSTYNEDKQAVFDEMKKLACKLADMSEDEMQRFVDSKGTHFRMELGKTFSDTKENFDGVRDRAVEEKGIVMPNLNKESVKVVPIEKHNFGNSEEGAIDVAKKWAYDNIATKDSDNAPTMRDGTPYIISKKAIDKYLSKSATSKSENLGVHLSVLPKLTDVIHESIEAEIHPDYKKGEDGTRSSENGYGDNVLIHRLYGAVELDGKMYRVKTTMQEFRGGEENKPHSYEVTKIELLEGSEKANESDSLPLNSASNSSKNELSDSSGTAVKPDSSPLSKTSDNSKNELSNSPGERESPDKPHSVASDSSISVAKLLNGVEKSYDSGKKLLDESKDLTDGETYFRDVNQSKNVSNGGSIVSDHVAKIANKVGSNVNMVNSPEEVTNPAVKERLDKGENVTGWYDEKTGEVHLYMPNIHDSYTAEKTIWHEVVGHKGMRGLFGDKFNDFLRSIYYDLDKPENAALKKLVDDERKYNPLNIYDSIEEGIARLAEEGKGEPGFWNTIKNKVTDFLHEIGYRIAPNTKDVKYLLWLSKNLQKNPNSVYWKLKANAVRAKLDREVEPVLRDNNGFLVRNDGKPHNTLLDLRGKEFEQATDGKVHFRTSPMAASKIAEYNRRLGTKMYAFKESTVDYLQSLQEAMEVISGEKDVWRNIPSAFNPLQAANRIDSACQQICERYDREITEPLDKSFKKLVSLMSGIDELDQKRNAELYMIQKHGLERNRILFVRDALRQFEDESKIARLKKEWNQERADLTKELNDGTIRLDEYYQKMDKWIVDNIDGNFLADDNDYSGFHELQGKGRNDMYDDKAIIDNVMSIESQIGDAATDFWEKKKVATDFVIDQEYTNGFIDKERREYLKSMFNWYVPLRKFDDTTAEDIYGYITERSDPSSYFGPTIANARGRYSLSDVNIMAQISAMAKSSVINGGKNIVKQHLARFIQSYEGGNMADGLFVEIKPWAEKHVVDGKKVWVEVTPTIPDNATQKEISDIIQDFEDDMQSKMAKGDAKVISRRGDVGYRFQRSKDRNEHIVDVYMAGKKRRFFLQGNPRAAQAVNGLLKDSGTSYKLTEWSAKLNRLCAQLNTSYNPDFLLSNMMRDLTTSNAMLAKEGVRYVKAFGKEYAKNLASFWKAGDSGNYWTMFSKYRNNKLDMNNTKEKYFKEFMENGGQTGYVHAQALDKLMREYDNLIKSGNKDVHGWLVRQLSSKGGLIEAANEIIENLARYSTYTVSRKRGRSIGRSIYDAKEVSGNFNRHGSGDAIRTLKTESDNSFDAAFRGGIGWFNHYMKNHTMFYNAGIQGANMYVKSFKQVPKTAITAFCALPFGLNIAVGLLNSLLINSEDEKKRNGVRDPYAELPEWKRRNNICIYRGNGHFVTIPLGIELRAFYGLGDVFRGCIDKDYDSGVPIGWDILGQLAQIVPDTDFMGHHAPADKASDALKDLGSVVAPTSIKPFYELAANRDWTGRDIYRDADYLDNAPRWKKAHENTPIPYMTVNQWVNKATNGIDSSNPDMKGNETLDFVTAPYGVQHVVEGYFGGAMATLNRAMNLAYATGKATSHSIKGEPDAKELWDNIDENQIPFWRVFNYSVQGSHSMQRTKSKWYNYKGELEQVDYNYSQIKTNTPDSVQNIKNAAKIHEFGKTPEGKRLLLFNAAEKYIQGQKYWMKQASDPETIEALQHNIDMKMQETVDSLDKIK